VVAKLLGEPKGSSSHCRPIGPLHAEPRASRVADTNADVFRTVANITGDLGRDLIFCDHCSSLATASR
jgi:hypothetical protein